MAVSPSHRFGQIIGDLLEEIMEPHLQKFCDGRGLYLDKKGVRGSVRKGKKLTWEDKFGNAHDLDFVIEKGGSDQRQGRPIAFIEAAWRRYTKHSRNKAQEIQGALLPIAEKYEWDKPFLGAVLAGVFTDGSLTQMKSSGFEVMLFPYDTIVESFGDIGINAAFDEGTPDDDFQRTVDLIQGLSSEERIKLKEGLIGRNMPLLKNFENQLEATLNRLIERILVIPLHGRKNEFTSIDDAIDFINSYDESIIEELEFMKYEVIVHYSNSDKIDAYFSDKNKFISFLEYVRSSDLV